ncbi:ATP-binding protein [Azospirillum thiophilum]|uniref:ATP-binding protein n=1 Tax=Azospirillum thiophilum TaxID=528244 RepID=UPI0006961454|nr:ATP-binding protein [Azospirillum thiophilum]
MMPRPSLRPLRLDLGGLFWKLFLSLWLAMMLSFAGGVSYLHLAGYRDATDSLDAVRTGVLLSTAEGLLARTGTDAAVSAIAGWNADPAAPPVALVADDGRRLVGSPAAVAGAGGHRRTVLGADGRRYILAAAVEPAGAPGPRPSVLVPLVSGGVVALLFSGLLAWSLSRPLRTLSWALHAVARGDFATRVHHRMGGSRDEIAALGADFDRMADRLQQLVEGRQRLLHDISHELRSPLTRMQAAIGLLRQNPAKTAAMIERIDREAERLDAMVGELLTLARLEVGSGVIARERVDLVELLAAIAEDATFEAEACGRGVRFAADGQFVCTVAAEVLCRAFENIIRNAVKFTAAGTVVEVAVKPLADGGLGVEVVDHGPGVPAEMLDRIFEPFLRLDGSGSGAGTAGGFGLGLAIARRAIESHGGTVRAAASPQGGLAVTVTLPAALSAAPAIAPAAAPAAGAAV